MNDTEYRQLPGVNWSLLKHMRTSPLAYRYHCDHPSSDTDAFRVGRAIHCLILEPSQFRDRYVVFQGRRQGKAWDTFRDEHADQCILTENQMNDVSEMANAIYRNPVMMNYVHRATEFECVYQWVDPVTELPCKCRIDGLNAPSRILIDLKSCQSIEEIKFGRDAAKFGYHGQMAHYGNGIQARHGWFPEQLVLLAVENKPPYDGAVFVMGEDETYASRQMVGELLEQVKHCMDANQWPGRYIAERSLCLPSYIFDAEDEDETFGLQMGNN